MKTWIIAACLAAALALAGLAGHHVAALAGQADLATAQAGWAKEREGLATARANAETAQHNAEQGQAMAITAAAQNYLKGKDDAEASSAATVADLRSGALRLRDQWATCRTTVAAGLPSASGGQQPDGGADDREEGAGNLVRAATDADAQISALQEVLRAERR